MVVMVPVGCGWIDVCFEEHEERIISLESENSNVIGL